MNIMQNNVSATIMRVKLNHAGTGKKRASPCKFAFKPKTTNQYRLRDVRLIAALATTKQIFDRRKNYFLPTSQVIVQHDNMSAMFPKQQKYEAKKKNKK